MPSETLRTAFFWENTYLCIRRTSAVLLRSGRLYGENDTKTGTIFVF